MTKRIKHGMPRIRAFTTIWNDVVDLNWWASSPRLCRVKVAELIATQPSVTAKGLKTVERDWRRPIFVVRINNRLYIRDGHHRATRALQRGQKTIRAWVATIAL